MLLEITKSVTLRASAADTWAFMRDPVRVAACLPNLRDFAPAVAPAAGAATGAATGATAASDPTGPAANYTTVLTERLGLFQVSIPLAITVSEDAIAQRLSALISGDDRAGQARVRGEVRATVTPAGAGSTVEITSQVEVLGRMAALGAVPMRRRGDQIFEQFVRTIGIQLESPE